MKLCFCQISDTLINPKTGSLPERFYNAIWQTKQEDGYYKSEHFWELPLWIAEICYTLPRNVERVLHIIDNLESACELFGLPDADYYLFSVLDVNKDLIKTIIDANSHSHFILGGYINDVKWEVLKNAMWFDSVPDLFLHFNWTYEYGTDFSLFEGIECIPRLTLSTGCKHRCKFCIVPNELNVLSYQECRQQVKSFEPLKFKLVYLNDKTFGQAHNYWWLKEFYYTILQYNPDFQGFIVQTTANQVHKMPEYDWQDCHIKVVEIGIETYNDELLKRYRKPAKEHVIENAIRILNQQKIKVITNIILGLPGETDRTYFKTCNYLRGHSDDLYALNIYTLAAYYNAGLDVEVGEKDTDELHDDRSFWTDEERTAFRCWSVEFYKLGIKIVRK
jgi:hypothetical protein